ncbi:hypothetical protein FOA52_009396 [Chlamydomonas sp. UWO 241]|nr:hypothetical protein FOA52_009396 [Chlamydomonas sp. UWO 241]
MAFDALYASKKLFASFKKAAWIASTTTLILLVPLIIEMDREAQITEMEKEQMNVLTGSSSRPLNYPSPAAAATMASTSPRAAAVPILSLYRSIMRLHHEKLTGPLRALGDDYVRHEFRSHLRKASPQTTQTQWTQFVRQWTDYKAFVSGGGGEKAPLVDTSEELSPELLEAMSPDQRKRVEELRAEAGRLGGKGEPRGE